MVQFPLSSAPRTNQEQLSGENDALKDGIQVMLRLTNTELSRHTGGGFLELWACTSLYGLLAQLPSILKVLRLNVLMPIIWLSWSKALLHIGLKVLLADNTM